MLWSTGSYCTHSSMTHRLLQELKQLQDAVVSKDEELCAASTNGNSFDSSIWFVLQCAAVAVDSLLLATDHD